MLTEINFTEFKKLLARDIKESESFVVTADGGLLFICVIPQTSFLREQVKEACVLSNTVGGKKIAKEIS